MPTDVRFGSEVAEPLPAASVRFAQCQRESRQSAYGQDRPFRFAPNYAVQHAADDQSQERSFVHAAPNVGY